MVIDTHVHLGKDPGYLEELIETAASLAIDRIILFTAGPGFNRATNEQVMEAHLAYPDTIIPFYYFRLGEEDPKACHV